jgi:two-component sensor histidine kinase
LKNYSAIRLIFLMVCILTSVNTLLAQKSSIEKLKFKLESKKYSNYTRSYFADSLLLHYRKTNPDSALFFTRKMYFLVINDTSQNNIDYCITHLGSLHRIVGNLDSSIFYYKIALKSYQKRKYEEGIASIYNNMATVYKTQNRYDLAIRNYLEALDIFKNSKNHNAKANLLSGLAGLYFKLENTEKAFEYWKESEKEYLKGEPKHEVSHAYRGKSRVYHKNGDFKKAMTELKKAIASDSIFGIDVFLVENLLFKMEILLDQKNPDGINKKAFDHLSVKLSRILRYTDIPMVKVKYHDLMGDRFLLDNDSKMALTHYDSCLAVDKDEDAPELILSILRKKFEIQLADKNYNLIIPFKILMQLEKHVTKLKNERITQETDARYSLKDKEEKIKFLDERNKVANELIESEQKLALQSKRQILWMWVGIGLFIGFIIYVLITNRKLKSTQKELQKNIEQKDFLFRELNHRVKNNLHIVSSFLSIESHGKTEEVKEILHTCENRIHSLGLVHEMLYQGEIFENIELDSYFEKLLNVISETLIDDKTKIISTIEKGLSLTSNKTVLLGLIANELITNSIKYAKTPYRDLIIQLTIKSENGKSIMKIADNGIGITEKDLRKNSLGMKLAKGLTNQLGGEFSFENLEQGIEFTIQF